MFGLDPKVPITDNPHTSKLISQLEEQLTCAVCTDVMYCPCVTSCGHTFCYNCLYEWFKNKNPGKTCPTCRAVFVAKPYVSFQLKSIVDGLLAAVCAANSDLTPTINEAREKALELYSEDVELRKETFPMLFDDRENLVDNEDGVNRCPYCHWELHGGYCEHCDQYVIRRGNRVGDSEEDDEGDDVEGGDITADYSEPDDYEDDGFIVRDDDEQDFGGDDSFHMTQHNAHHYGDDEDNEDGEDSDVDSLAQDLAGNDTHVSISSDEGEGEGEGPVRPKRRTVVFSSDEEQEGGNGDGDGDADSDVEMMQMEYTNNQDFHVDISDDDEFGGFSD